MPCPDQISEANASKIKYQTVCDLLEGTTAAELMHPPATPESQTGRRRWSFPQTRRAYRNAVRRSSRQLFGKPQLRPTSQERLPSRPPHLPSFSPPKVNHPLHPFDQHLSVDRF